MHQGLSKQVLRRHTFLFFQQRHDVSEVVDCRFKLRNHFGEFHAEPLECETD